MNLLPIIGAIFWGWTPFSVIFVYWLESLGIVGFSSIKILISKGDGNKNLNVLQAIGFGFKYTAMLLFYLLFIVVFIGAGLELMSNANGFEEGTEFYLDELEFTKFLLFTDSSFRYSMLSFVLIKVLYFFTVFIKEKHYLSTKVDDLKKGMISRTITKHLVIIIGFIAAVLLTTLLEMNLVAITFACVFVLIKSVIDYFSKQNTSDEV
jgi:hypothetical protein